MRYVGRFAPSPSGDLHLGSLFTAVASFLDARAQEGSWLVRIEDLDRPRELPGAAGRILRCLEAFGLHWDGPPLRQSDRQARYRDCIAALWAQGRLYRCACPRQALQGQAIYPGTCRRNPAPLDSPAALRFALDTGTVRFEDRIQGSIEQDPAATQGDFVVQRRDGILSYMLAVVVDDADQGVSEVMRGADLLDSTGAQIQLQRSLGFPTPGFAHLPLLLEPDGSKLAKSRRSVPVDPAAALPTLRFILSLLGQPPCEEPLESPGELLTWAARRWRVENITRQRQITLR